MPTLMGRLKPEIYRGVIQVISMKFTLIRLSFGNEAWVKVIRVIYIDLVTIQ